MKFNIERKPMFALRDLRGKAESGIGKIEEKRGLLSNPPFTGTHFSIEGVTDPDVLVKRSYLAGEASLRMLKAGDQRKKLVTDIDREIEKRRKRRQRTGDLDFLTVLRTKGVAAALEYHQSPKRRRYAVLEQEEMLFGKKGEQELESKDEDADLPRRELSVLGATILPGEGNEFEIQFLYKDASFVFMADKEILAALKDVFSKVFERSMSNKNWITGATYLTLRMTVLRGISDILDNKTTMSVFLKQIMEENNGNVRKILDWMKEKEEAVSMQWVKYLQGMEHGEVLEREYDKISGLREVYMERIQSRKKKKSRKGA
jgi:hypothetical protein